ncbi:MAG TPA: 23S rRNA (adenine(2030)-N(6))-methyltransferase RlmJ [Rubrivivax sp.]|nr:23S rRNA (adenine(2030)-N(6))-methyltransferase RlmJ [Rubrivivax sp.]
MLAYRHAFHAGNHADVLKHLVLVQLLQYLRLKDKGLRIVDTHAGAGLYALDSPEAQKKGEYLQGVARIRDAHDTPAAVADYLQLLRRFNAGGVLRQYPGSPLLAQALLRPQDQLRLFELHPADHQALQALLGGARGVDVQQADGFARLKSQLPPPTRRALVLIDPSYEGHGDYAQVTATLRDALRRFAEGVYMVWMPQVAKPGAAALPRTLMALAPRGWLHARLTLQQPDALGFGLAGSSVVVINPPHTLHAALQPALPWLVRELGQYPGASHLLEQHAP